MAAAMQAASRTRWSRLHRGFGRPGGITRSTKERVWSKAIHRVAADGISPEQAVDEAIARIKQILAE